MPLMNDPVKLIAVLAAAALLLAPYLPAVLKRMRSAWASLPSVPVGKEDIGTDDLTMVLDLANRLRRDGNEPATKLARELLDAMLTVQK